MSGVPQGSVLGPLLFTIYIDDVVTQISPSSSISLYADDIALYRSIHSPADYVILQADITAIATWVEEVRYLKLHADKCHFMLVSRKCTCSIAPPPLYAKAGTPLQQVNTAKYLGVLLTSDLSWNEHITRVCSKTRKLIGLFYRRFHHCSPELLLRLYKFFICPHLEYASQVWDPRLAKDTDLLEKTQKFGLRVCCKDWSASYSDLLDLCQVSSLSSRRRAAKLCLLYKVIYRLVDCENAPVAHRALQYSCRRSNPLQIQTLFAHLSQYQFSFYPHSISLWNSLSLNNESLSSFATFKRFITVIIISVISLLEGYMLCISFLAILVNLVAIISIRNVIDIIQQVTQQKTI